MPAGSAASSGQCRWPCRHVAHSCRVLVPRPERASRVAAGSELSVDDVLERVVHERLICIHALELCVLLLQLAQLRQVRDSHARKLTFPRVVGSLRPCLRQVSLTFAPSSTSLRMPTIWLSMNLDFFCRDTDGWDSLLLARSGFQGGFRRTVTWQGRVKFGCLNAFHYSASFFYDHTPKIRIIISG